LIVEVVWWWWWEEDVTKVVVVVFALSADLWFSSLTRDVVALFARCSSSCFVVGVRVSVSVLSC
jgi:hypothetical protein